MSQLRSAPQTVYDPSTWKPYLASLVSARLNTRKALPEDFSKYGLDLATQERMKWIGQLQSKSLNTQQLGPFLGIDVASLRTLYERYSKITMSTILASCPVTCSNSPQNIPALFWLLSDSNHLFPWNADIEATREILFVKHQFAKNHCAKEEPFAPSLNSIDFLVQKYPSFIWYQVNSFSSIYNYVLDSVWKPIDQAIAKIDQKFLDHLPNAPIPSDDLLLLQRLQGFFPLDSCRYFEINEFQSNVSEVQVSDETVWKVTTFGEFQKVLERDSRKFQDMYSSAKTELSAVSLVWTEDFKWARTDSKLNERLLENQMAIAASLHLFLCIWRDVLNWDWLVSHWTRTKTFDSAMEKWISQETGLIQSKVIDKISEIRDSRSENAGGRIKEISENLKIKEESLKQIFFHWRHNVSSLEQAILFMQIKAEKDLPFGIQKLDRFRYYILANCIYAYMTKFLRILQAYVKAHEIELLTDESLLKETGAQFKDKSVNQIRENAINTTLGELSNEMEQMNSLLKKWKKVFVNIDSKVVIPSEKELVHGSKPLKKLTEDTMISSFNLFVPDATANIYNNIFLQFSKWTRRFGEIVTLNPEAQANLKQYRYIY